MTTSIRTTAGPIDYTPITELPGIKANREQIARAYHHYWLALDYCAGKDVLEVACGGGQGLGLLATRARSVVAGDYMLPSVQTAAKHCQGRVPLLQLDGQMLPFATGSFDVVLLFEAIYYLPDAARFVAECRRALRAAGTLLIGTVNKDWADFNPGAFTTRYFSATEIRSLLEEHDFDTRLMATFPAVADSSAQKMMSLVRRAAARLGLIPKLFKYKALLKRLFYGRLVTYPVQLTEGVAPYEPAVPIAGGEASGRYKILYALGRRQ